MPNLWDAFATIAEAVPTAPALTFAQQQVSFGELKALANRCAAHLEECGVKHGNVVALQLPKRRLTYALLLASLRLGAPYVFLDPKSPPGRGRHMIERLRPAILFTTVETMANPYGRLIHLSPDSSIEWPEDWIACGPRPNRPAVVIGSDPAYIMFTSGSTGEPKGAVISHQGVLSLMVWARTHVGQPGRERLTNINPLHFDNSVFDIYGGLFNGAALIPIETSEITNPATWVKTIRAANASFVFAVPTLFLIFDRLGLLTRQSLPSVRTFMFGGEGFPIDQLRDFYQRFKESTKFINVYGPTETSCISTSLELTDAALDAAGGNFPPLGKMHSDFSHLILDPDLRPIDKNGVGELWIGGPCVGLGYYRSPDETAARFRQNPLLDGYRSIYYRSGDLVREDQGGILWFHGRVDNQVKVRGHRIELEEIDLAVQDIPGVTRAVAVVVPSADGAELKVAFMAERQIATDEVYAACRTNLPAYMWPAEVFQVDDLPRNANGKVDRSATRSLLLKGG